MTSHSETATVSEAEIEAAARSYDRSESMYSKLREGFSAGARWVVERSTVAAKARAPSAATGWKMDPSEIETKILQILVMKANVNWSEGIERAYGDAAADITRYILSLLAASPTPLGSPPVDALVKALENRANGYEARGDVIYNGNIIAEELRLWRNEVAALKLYRGEAS